MRRSLILILSLATTACTCCTGRQHVGHEETPRAHQPETIGQRRNREFTVVWGNTGRGGAAMRLPAYIHVLAPTASKPSPTPRPPLSVPVEQEPIILFPANPGAGTVDDRSIYSKDHTRIAHKRQKP